MTRVLVVDDEPQILRTLRINLQARDYEVVTAGSGRSALQAATDTQPDLVVLDLGLPDMDGVEVVRSLRTWTSVPILILSGRLNSQAKVEALDAGADDYVTKPFNVDELFARVRAVTRRTGEPEHPEPVRIGDWLVDAEDRTARRVDGAGPGDASGEADGEDGRLHLTPTEWQLLQALVRHPGRLVGQRQLLQEVWGPTYVEQTHYLRQYMKTLRRKLEPDPSRPRHLITEAGMGYRFQP
ncbi:response regulator [Microlunatus spumicola]|uniref:Response regulator n=1 Tax=Microlunatus spumicola TaxID=81499 RepID=A0ABP6Y3C4_9ACTN